MRYLFLYGILFLFSISFSGLKAGSGSFRQYQMRDGLSNNNIACCLQGPYGFMWFGTRDGLNRFDDYSFRIFRNDADQPGSIGSNWILAMTLDSSGQLWIGTQMGVYLYKEKEESFQLIPFTEGRAARELYFSPEGDLWFLLDDKLVRYDEELQVHKIYADPDDSTLTSFCISFTGQYWLTTSAGRLYLMDVEKGGFRKFDLFEHSMHINSRVILTAYPDKQGEKVWIGTLTHGIKIFDIRKGDYTDLLRYDPEYAEIMVKDFIQVADTEMWVATESGLYRYNLETAHYTHMTKRKYDPYSLSSNSLHAFCLDREGGVWIGTYSGGVNYYSPLQLFTPYYSIAGMNTLRGDIVHDICTDENGYLWVATEDSGLNRMDLLTGEFRNYHIRSLPDGLSQNNIHGLVPDGDRLWIGTLSNGIDLLHIPTGRVLNRYVVGGIPDNESSYVVVVMKKLRNGQLLAGTEKGVYLYRPDEDRFSFLSWFPAQYKVQTLFEDHAGVIWAGMVNGGVYYYDPVSKEGHYFQQDMIYTSSANTVNDIYEDKELNLWFATLEGVKKYDRRTGVITRYTIKNGMPGNTTFRILEDKTGNLWISTSNGLVCLHPGTEEIFTYTVDHGLITDQFNYNSAWKDEEGKMYFGMIRGMIRFLPEEIKTIDQEPEVFITHIRVDTQEYEDRRPAGPGNRTKKVELKSGRYSTLRFDFSTLGYIAPDAIRYAYCMEGLDNTWTSAEESRSAYYSKLPSGNYLFKVKASNASGVWNDYFTSLQISVLPPWWWSAWMKIFYFVLFVMFCICSLYGLKKHDQKSVEQTLRLFEDKKEKELYQTKIEFFINIAHEIRTPLTLIKSPLEKVLLHRELTQDIRRSLDTVNKNADRLLALVNQLLDFRKTEIEGFSLNFVKTDILTTIENICIRFKDAAEERGLLFNIQTTVTQLQAFIDQEAFTKILSNLLLNAIKYARTKICVEISFLTVEDLFVIDVINDGEEIPEELKERIFEPFFRGESAQHTSGTGLGLPLARSMAEMHRETLFMENSDRDMIRFRLSLPINQPNSIKWETEEKLPVLPEQNYAYDPARPTILIVEDHEEMKNFVGEEINQLYNVLTARNGVEGLEIVKQESIQLLISDVMMPVMDGFSLLKTIKNNLEYSHIPIILLTAKNTLQSRLEGLESSADAYITKPFSMEILVAQITNLLNNRLKMRNYYFKSPVAHMKSMAYTKADEKFLEKLHDIIDNHIADVDLDVDQIAGFMHLSRPTLYRKIKAISDLTPNELITISRLKKAAELILQGHMRIYEISEAVGFSSQSYFSRAFSRQFNMAPSQFAKNNNLTLK